MKKAILIGLALLASCQDNSLNNLDPKTKELVQLERLANAAIRQDNRGDFSGIYIIPSHSKQNRLSVYIQDTNKNKMFDPGDVLTIYVKDKTENRYTFKHNNNYQLTTGSEVHHIEKRRKDVNIAYKLLVR